MTVLDLLAKIDMMVFAFIMLIVFIMFRDKSRTCRVKVLPKENFCTCRGMQYNNSEGNPNQANCYPNKIPAQVWDESHAGCTSFEDAGKISYDYEINHKQLPDFAGV